MVGLWLVCGLFYGLIVGSFGTLLWFFYDWFVDCFMA